MQNEMAAPDGSAGMKQRHNRFRGRIDSGEVWPFVTVAPVTRPGKVIEKRLATVPAGNNVFEVKGF